MYEEFALLNSPIGSRHWDCIWSFCSVKTLDIDREAAEGFINKIAANAIALVYLHSLSVRWPNLMLVLDITNCRYGTRVTGYIPSAGYFCSLWTPLAPSGTGSPHKLRHIDQFTLSNVSYKKYNTGASSSALTLLLWLYCTVTETSTSFYLRNSMLMSLDISTFVSTVTSYWWPVVWHSLYQCTASTENFSFTASL